MDDLGPFFALEPEAGDDWTPVRTLLDDPAATDAAIDRIAGRLGTDNRAVAGSLFVQGWAGRLTSIFAAAAAHDGRVPDLAAANVHYRYAGDAPVRLAIDDPVQLDSDQAWQRVTDEHLRPLIEAVHDRCRAGRRQLWGNVASALAGSLASLDRAGVATLPALLATTWASPPDFAELGWWAHRTSYARRTCCGLFRAPEPRICADCSIVWEPRRRAQDR